MTASRSIETGVDRLVNLINAKSRISLNDAAKELGVSIPVLQEWADFLEDEGLISLEYKLSRTYLCERKLSKTEVEKKAKIYSSKKDAFTRQVEGALQSLQKETLGLDSIKQKFDTLKDAIGTDIDQIREELQELKHYEDLKKNIDRDLIQQKLEYQEMIASVHRGIDEQRKKYDYLIETIEGERAKIEEEVIELSYLEKRMDTLDKRIDAIKEIIKSLEKGVANQKNEINKDLKKIKSDLKTADALKKDIKFRMKTEFDPLIKDAKQKEEKILAVQDSILKKVMDKKKKMDKYKKETISASDEFKRFFNKKVKTQEMINSLENDRKELEKELADLVNKATTFNLSLKSSSVKNYVKELEVSFKKIEKKKSTFSQNLIRLTEMIRAR